MLVAFSIGTVGYLSIVRIVENREDAEETTQDVLKVFKTLHLSKPNAVSTIYCIME